MKISRSLRENEVRFGDLEPGEIFIGPVTKKVFMKIHSTPDNRNAVCLEDGESDYEEPDYTIVEKINAHLVEEAR